jgi:hypothetical protein
MMEKIISYCGITCSECPAFLATQTNSDSERKRVAELWTKEYSHEFKSSDINCDGCTSNSKRVFTYCTICGIRKCGTEKQVKNCAFCADYPCEKVLQVHSASTKAKETLDNIRNKQGVV